MAEAKLKALSSDYTKPASPVARRRISHRHSSSTPVLPIPTLSFSSTSSSRTSATESTLATPINSVYSGYIPHINADSDSDTPTPTPSPKTKARTPTRFRSATTVLAGQNPSIFRKFTIRNRESPSRAFTRARPSLAMSPEIHLAPRADSVQPGRAVLTSPMSLPASPLHQTTMLSNDRPVSRSELLLKSALLKDEFAQGSFSSNGSPKHHRRRHSHSNTAMSAESLLYPNNIPSAPLSPLARNEPARRPRPASPVHTKSAPAVRTPHTRPHPRSPSYSHALNEAPASTRIPLTPHEQVLRARLEKVLNTSNVPRPSSGADDDFFSAYASYHEAPEEEYSHSPNLMQSRQKAEHKRKRASAPANGPGIFGWIWKASEENEEVFNIPSTPRRLQSETSYSHPNSPRTPRTPHLHNAEASPSLSPYRVSSPQLSPSPSRVRAQTQPLPLSPNRSPFGQGYASSPKPKHAFSLGTIQSTSNAIPILSGEDDHERAGRGRMLTPPPTPPQNEGALLGPGDGFGQVDSPVDLTESQHRGTTQPTPAEKDLESSLVRRASSATSSGRGRSRLGLGRPGKNTSNSDDHSVSSASLSEELVLLPSVITVGAPSDDRAVVITDTYSSPRPLIYPLLSPTDARSTSPSFNARTASLQCRQIDGYVSFASVEGLGEPPASALSVEGDEGSMNGDEAEGQNRGWIGLGRLFRR